MEATLPRLKTLTITLNPWAGTSSLSSTEGMYTHLLLIIRTFILSLRFFRNLDFILASRNLPILFLGLFRF